MSSIIIPEGYQSLLGLYDTQKAIGLIKTIFQEKICMALHLKRVTAPLFVMQGSGLNDDLNGVERPVEFDVPSLNEHAEIVHSLAKWKRYALYKYGFRPGQGIVTDMNAVMRNWTTCTASTWISGTGSALSPPTSARWNFCRRLYGILWMRSARPLTSCAGSSLN